MSVPQSGILADVPREARSLELDLAPGADATAVLHALARWPASDDLLVGLGASFCLALGATVPGLRVHPHHVGPGFEIPSTPSALWLRVLGADRGHILHRSRRLLAELGDQVVVDRVVDTFKYGDGNDLSGYEDGTENPKDDDAAEAALCQRTEAGLGGGSYVAVQQWVHHLDAFDAMSPGERDHVIGRRAADNVELQDAPPSAHVKRAAQESYDPPAFMLRRSMPWTDGRRQGLLFLAFGRSFDAYEAVLARMAGREDGTPDALFRFTRPISGACYWCPPVRDGRLDLRALA